ncbi:MmgE/PrpD family protein [Bradyrhizobium sp. 2]|nr:MmgE/PrpD family protein [Bradyrhizobium sp. 2]
MDAVLDLKCDNGFLAEDVSTINVTVTEAHARNLAYSRPDDETQARFSMQYALALALSQDSLGLSDFTSTAIRRDDVRTPLPLTELSIYDQTIERTATGRLPHRVTVTLKDGRRLDEIRQAAEGDASLPFSPDERKIKSLDCVRFSGLPAAKAQELFSRSSRPRRSARAISRIFRFERVYLDASVQRARCDAWPTWRYHCAEHVNRQLRLSRHALRHLLTLVVARFFLISRCTRRAHVVF